MEEEFVELIAMKKTRKKPNEGDIFVVQPMEHHFYFGKVIKTNIESKNLNFTRMNLIYLYDFFSQDKEMPTDLDSYNFLLPPTVVNFQGWKQGYFETVGNQAVTLKEASVDYGFFDDYETQDRFYSLERELLERKPKCVQFEGIASYGYIGRQIHQNLYGAK